MTKEQLNNLLINAREDVKKAEQNLEDQQTKEAKIYLASVISDNSIPENATITFFDWAEEAAPDSETCDISLSEAVVDDDVILDFGEKGYDAQPYGRVGETIWTLWDDFLNEEGEIEVAKVNEYINNL